LKNKYFLLKVKNTWNIDRIKKNKFIVNFMRKCNENDHAFFFTNSSKTRFPDNRCIYPRLPPNCNLNLEIVRAYIVFIRSLELSLIFHWRQDALHERREKASLNPKSGKMRKREKIDYCFLKNGSVQLLHDLLSRSVDDTQCLLRRKAVATTERKRESHAVKQSGDKLSRWQLDRERWLVNTSSATL